MSSTKRFITPQEFSAAQVPSALLDIHMVSALVGFAEITIRQWARQGKFPKPITFGRSVRWRSSDVMAWSADRGIVWAVPPTVTPTA
jgi:predicted DNA-binding transcriptional regulator AlpA